MSLPSPFPLSPEHEFAQLCAVKSQSKPTACDSFLLCINSRHTRLKLYVHETSVWQCVAVFVATSLTLLVLCSLSYPLLQWQPPSCAIPLLSLKRGLNEQLPLILFSFFSLQDHLSGGCSNGFVLSGRSLKLVIPGSSISLFFWGRLCHCVSLCDI